MICRERRKAGGKEGRRKNKGSRERKEEGGKERRKERKEGKKECQSVFHVKITICSLPPHPHPNYKFGKVARRKVISF